jgi:hypothetical protein
MTKKPANDNVKVARGSLAGALTAVLEFRNRPDSPPDPLQSSWSTDPSTVIPDGAFDGDDEPEAMAEDLLLEITPSITKIMHEVKVGSVKRKGGRNGAIVEIGKLHFSDGTQTEQAMVNGAAGVELKKVVMRPGSMLGTSEKLGGSHGGTGAAVVTIGNAALSGRLTGWKLDEHGKQVPKHHRPYIPSIRDRRKGKSLSAEQSRANLAEAIANTPVMPPVTVCPPGVASGTARYSDQFIGMKIGSSGKGGAPSWTDEFMAMRDHQDWQAAIREAEPQHVAVIKAAMSAKAIADLGDCGHRRTMERQGWRKLTAANDNLAQNKRKFAA